MTAVLIGLGVAGLLLVSLAIIVLSGVAGGLIADRFGAYDDLPWIGVGVLTGLCIVVGLWAGLSAGGVIS